MTWLQTVSSSLTMVLPQASGLIQILLFVGSCGLVGRVIHVWWRLRHVPGPFLPSFSDYFRVKWVQSSKAHFVHQDLHRKYGSVVRMGPNMVSIGDPEAVPLLYPMRRGFLKADFYVPLRPYSRTGGALPAVFTSLDEDMHSRLKRPIAQIFSLSSVVTFEGLVEDVLQVIHAQLDNRFKDTGEVFNLGEWLQYFAFDVMGTLSFNKRYGFLEQGEDVGNKLDAVWQFMKQAAPMMQVPWLDKILYKNQYVDMLRRTPGNSLLQFVGQTIGERQRTFDDKAKVDAAEGNRKDFLDRYIEIQRNNPEIPPWAVHSWTFSNVIAGSDSVGVVMQTAMYHILKNETTRTKLVQELQEASVSRPYPQWSEVSKLPYLDACVLEALRMHPPFALPFERVVPEGGITICGTYLPEGTIVGASPYVTNRDTTAYGEDSDDWRPERWIECGPERKRHLENILLTFGAGRRICLGRYIGIFEIKKLIPFLVLQYDMRIADEDSFTAENFWFFKHKGLFARMEVSKKELSQN